ncbi:hypothetical protein [Aliivibrio fischeri]|uniref:Lipoprotein n=1 Tax=Aliivibrio fischeri TaxID=668 RepID=A0A844P1Z3_ALIFS|nr:hypothetical protein [Aliivibrio fischeri]MUJ25694.1 hypothetical protein [Aliivibrio fischeri]MUK28033.1 hypothetical protein [Aliivibrio fischeri]MUK34999.1 hypothetical protein [Aliivibrio fischeri]MUK49350.1 hypothetical protein [Aliivibrio fischeri]MUL08702.1 hypothetical protein [Aliivibrio fischeri]
MINWKGMLFLPLVLMTGCVETVNERFGPEIDVFPVTYSVSLSNTRESKMSLSTFISDHKKELINYGANIQWVSQSGNRWASEIKKQLIKEGVNKDLIIISQGEKGDVYFDIKFSIVVHKTQVSSCQYAELGAINTVATGCFIENARWSSMVNPQKMLITPSVEKEHKEAEATTPGKEE